MYTSRIVRHATEHPEQLLAHPDNFRIHGKAQQDALHTVMSDVGIVQTVIVNEVTGHVIDGHLRIALALRHNEQSIPVTYVQLTEDEERIILATFDPIGDMAIVDRQKLADLLEDVDIPTKELEDFVDSLKVENEIVDEVVNDTLHENQKVYMLVIEVPNLDAYNNVLLDMEAQGYKVRGNQ